MIEFESKINGRIFFIIADGMICDDIFGDPSKISVDIKKLEVWEYFSEDTEDGLRVTEKCLGESLWSEIKDLAVEMFVKESYTE